MAVDVGETVDNVAVATEAQMRGPDVFKINALGGFSPSPPAPTAWPWWPPAALAGVSAAVTRPGAVGRSTSLPRRRVVTLSGVPIATSHWQVDVDGYLADVTASTSDTVANLPPGSPT